MPLTPDVQDTENQSKEVYKRQVLSITSIAMAISLLGALCMALYCRNKRRREKLQAHLKESRSLKNYTANSHNALDAKLRPPNANLQMHEKHIDILKVEWKQGRPSLQAAGGLAQGASRRGPRLMSLA
ncbi:hypothetical protein KUCAC02_019260, partial [Chaenocephalus aceratus]